MFPSPNSTRTANFRYFQTLRRSHLARLAALGALVVIPTACAQPSDAQEFAGSDITVVTNAPVASSDTAATTTSDLPTSTSTSVPATTTTEAPPVALSGFPVGGEMSVDFTYAANGGRIRNPYIAIWVEDTNGNMVSTISVWYQSNRSQYLNHLSSWANSFRNSPSTYSPTTGATRGAGSYSVVWDGTDTSGSPVVAGDYVLYVEAAREHGPHSITSTPITIDGNGFTVSLSDSGELANLSATLKV